MSEDRMVGGSTREVLKRNLRANTPPAPQRIDAGTIGHGHTSAFKGHGTRGAAERIAAYQEQKQEVQRRLQQQRQAESAAMQRQNLDRQIAVEESRLQNLKRERARVGEAAQPTFAP